MDSYFEGKAENALVPTGGTPQDRMRRVWDALDKQYTIWKDTHKDISEYIAVGRGRFLDVGHSPYQDFKKNYRLRNPHPVRALGILGAGLHGGLSSPSRPWFQLALQDPEMNRYGPFRYWLDTAEKVLYSVLKQSNFYTFVHSVYEELGGFGTGCGWVEDHADNVVSFQYLTAGDYRFAVDLDGMTHTLARLQRWHAFQVVETFGKDNCSENALKLYERNPFDFIDVLHIVEPNWDRDPGKIDNRNMPWRSTWIERKEKARFLHRSGFVDMPAITPRWSALSQYSWGWGPGLWALGQSKALQKYERRSMHLTDKAADPPVNVPPNMGDRVIDLTPGAKNVVSHRDARVTPIFEVNLNALDNLNNKISQIEYRISQLFYNDLFLLFVENLAGAKTMTATEVLERHEEKLLMIGPVIERLLHEFLDPLVDLVLKKCLRRGLIPLPPEEMLNAGYKIEYISLLAQAQKLIMAQGMDNYLTTAERVFAIDPYSVFKTDWDAFLDERGDMVNLGSKVMRDDDEAKAMRDQAMQAEAQAAQAEQANLATQNVKNLGSASTDEGTALADIKKAITP